MSTAPVLPAHPAPDSTGDIVRDLMSGVVVFVVALPLCLGIALACGAPLISGVVAGVVAGTVVGWFSGARVTISGPAAGLVAVVAAEIEAIGSFEGLLLAVCIAGLIQVGFGFAQAGFIKMFVPTSVVRGLLSAIGVILILKQLPHLLGRDTDPEGEMSFFQPDRETTFSELLEMLSEFHPGAIAIGMASLALIFIWGRWSVARASGIPAPLMVAVFGIFAALGLEQVGGIWTIETSHRVQVPVAQNLTEFLSFLHTPDFSQIGNPAVLTSALAIALVASLQALMTTEAVDRLDRFRRTTPANRELIAQGIGNCVSGLVGGLPMTCEIVRSSVNIDAGARTKLSAIVHGVLLAASVLVFPRIINLIPLSCLAAILIATGQKLASPRVIGEMWRAGRYQFIPYAVTLVAIVLSDPLVGILIGLVVSIGFILWSNLRRPIKIIREHHLAGDVTRIELANQVSFLNRAALRKTLDALPRDKQVLIDAHDSVYIDPDILEMIREYRDTIGPSRGVRVSTRGFRSRYKIDDSIQYVDYPSRELQQELTPKQAFEYLREGNERFRTGQQLKRDLGPQVVATRVGQHPIAAVLSCIDSRSPAELLFDVGPGDIFSVQVAGNIATAGVLGSIEYACVVAGAKLIVVLGHTRCGFMGAAVEAACLPDVPVAPECSHLGPIMQSIGRMVDVETCTRARGPGAIDKQSAIDDVASRNVCQVVGEIQAASDVIRRLVGDGRVGIVGMVYDVSSGSAWVIPGTWACSTTGGSGTM